MKNDIYSRLRRAYQPKAIGLAACVAMLLIPAGGQASSGGVGTPAPTVAGKKAKLRNGKAIAPKSAPAAVKRAIAAANRIRKKPYIYGGGHSKWLDKGYDCSGSVSFALGKYGARKLRQPYASGSFMRHGVLKGAGKGKWITTYAKGSHMYAVIAGLRYDTSAMSGNHGNRWSKVMRSRKGYVARHPVRL